jgi:DNA-binding MltR family transcriptional regulator
MCSAKPRSDFIPPLVNFITGLAKEGERALVIGGAARLDVALERLLKSVTRHTAGGRDDLFDPERPLGTFSAKIALAYRLGLLEDHVEKALHLVRKVRNDFAHATTKVNLSESAHQNRLSEITKCVRECPIHERLRRSCEKEFPQISEFSASLLLALIILVTVIELSADSAKPMSDIYTADTRKLIEPPLTDQVS